MSDRIIIVGNYVLGAPLGSGATSEVFAAEHRFLGDPAAVKLLRVELADAAATDDFLGEAQKTRAVQHRNVVRVIDFGRDEASRRCYLVMERVDGGSLAARLQHEGRLPEAEVRRLGAAIADGMQAAHAVGIVHRDLKPANVMLDGGEPKIVDFGIAKSLGNADALATSRRVGTPAYMAPEQLTGGLIAPCVDVWALGVVLFEAATGGLPFQDFSGGRCPQLFEVAPRAAGVSPELARVIARCLERDPGKRPATMAEVAQALRGGPGAAGDERITQDAGWIAEPLPLIQPPPRRARRWWPVVIGASAISAAAVAVIVAVASDRSEPPPARSTEVAVAVPPVAMPSVVPTPTPIPIPTPTPTPPSPPPPPETKRAKRPSSSFFVDVRSVPAGAQILVNGAARGTTPGRVELSAPTTLVVKARGYKPSRVRAARGGPLEVRLVPSCQHPPCEDLD